jgi:tetratricopeptide (TPR) repeat protein
LDEINLEELSPEERAEWEKAQKKFRARMRGMTIFCLLLAVPICIGAYLVWRVKAHMAADQVWAEAELKKTEPDPLAYGALGSIYLNEGRIAESLPLLKRASEIESRAGNSAEAHLIYVEAHIEGLKNKVPGASQALAVAALKEMLSYTDKLAQGPRAAAWHGAGKLYGYLGMPAEALDSLKKAADLQPDDWVDEGGGRRYKRPGIASTYQKDYSGALYQ